jgi:molybdopterin-guanine dinucleotide biosynthesis protein B
VSLHVGNKKLLIDWRFLMKTVFLGFVGYSGSGKTTLIEKLIGFFSAEGYAVGAIKHDAHSFEIDYPGKDSYRLKHAGAKRIALSSKDKFALIEDRDCEKPFDEIKELYSDCDIVFIEGYKLEDIPKIEVHRSVMHKEYLIDMGISNIVTVATDETDKHLNVPIYHIDDIVSISEFIKDFIKDA